MTFGRGIETISCGFFTDPACKPGGRIESLPSARASASFWTVRNQTKSHRLRVVDCEARPSNFRLHADARPADFACSPRAGEAARWASGVGYGHAKAVAGGPIRILLSGG